MLKYTFNIQCTTIKHNNAFVVIEKNSELMIPTGTLRDFTDMLTWGFCRKLELSKVESVDMVEFYNYLDEGTFETLHNVQYAKLKPLFDTKFKS